MLARAALDLPAFQVRLDEQALSTRALRLPLYERVGLRGAQVLDVGCGTGSVTRDLLAAGAREVVALDADPAMLRRAAEGRDLPLLRADAHRLPFAGGAFDVAVCNLVLLWAADPARVVAEMARVVRPGGIVLASMEPDYGGKVHWPANPLIDLVFQGAGIKRRGGDPQAGRKLRAHFVAAGLRTEVGIGNPQLTTPDQDLGLFRRNRAYYRRMLAEGGFSERDIDAWEEEYLQSIADGVQLSHLPIFHAVGRKPAPGDAATV